VSNDRVPEIDFDQMTLTKWPQIVNKTTIRNMESSWEKVQGLHLVEAVTIVTIVTVIFAHMVEKGLVIRIEVSK